MTPRSARRVSIEGPAGPLELLLNIPETEPSAIALIAHPHSLQGGTLDNKVVQTLAKSLYAMGLAIVRLNFRGVGDSAGSFDEGVGETEDALAALDHARAAVGKDLPVVLAGFSFGAFVQTRVARRVEAQRLILVGPAVRRFAVEQVPADTIVIHGEEDEIVPLSDVLDWARPQQLPVVVFPGCGHFFHGRLPQLQRVITGMWRRA